MSQGFTLSELLLGLGEKPQKDEFGNGVRSMARSCQSAMKLLKDGTWTAKDVDHWLKAVIENDATYFEKAKGEILKKKLQSLTGRLF